MHRSISFLLPMLITVCSAVSCTGVMYSLGLMHSSQEPPKPLLYNWVPDGTPMVDLRSLHATKYTMVYQSVAGPSASRGIANTVAILKHLRDTLPAGFQGWGVFDFEGAFIENLSKDASDPAHQQTVDSLVHLIRAVKQEWPASRWSFWGFPTVRFWIHNKGEEPASWASASDEQKEREFRSAVDQFSVVATEVDWLSPWIYDVYPLSSLKHDASRQGTIKAQQLWAQAKIEAARRCTQGRQPERVPIIPMFRPLFAPGGSSFTPAFVPIEEFTEELLVPAIQAGVDGLATWNGLGHEFANAFRTATSPHHLQIRTDARRTLERLLFDGRSFQWDTTAAQAHVASLLRRPLLDQLQAMRHHLNTTTPPASLHEGTP